MIYLKEITSYDMFDECVELKIKEGQRLYSNAYSLAEAWLNYSIKEIVCSPFCIYKDDTMVGFVMLAQDDEDKEVSIYRFMIDEKHQNKGYGKEAMKVVLDYINNNPLYTDYGISLDTRRDNIAAVKIYTDLGFIIDEEEENGDIEMVLKRDK
jgi:diamine N-acetyltransferase